MHVFTYGSLMYPEVWTRVVAGRYRSWRGIIRNFERRRIVGASYPALMHGSGTVEGVVYCDVGVNDLAALDRFELEGEDYRRMEVPVALETGRTLTAWTYLYLRHDRIAQERWEPRQFEARDLPNFVATYCRAHAPGAFD